MSKILNVINKINNLKDYLKMLIVYIIRSLKNYFKIFFGGKFSNFYLPNLTIHNVININPNKIKYVNSIPMKFYGNTKFIINFDWDKENELLTKYEKKDYKSITCRELFVKNMKIKKCKSYFFFKKKLRKLKEFKNCKNEKDIILFLKRKISLYENIKNNGLKKVFNSNIEFMIDRKRNLVKINSGDHRFAISRILKLKKIPVEIKVIHLNGLGKNVNKTIQVKKINQIIKSVAKKYA